MKTQTKTPRGRLRLRAVLLGFAFLCLIFIGIPLLLGGKSPPSEETETGGLVPSEVLSHKSAYDREQITIHGKVLMERVVCQKQDCPVEDSCCGCPMERNLVVTDPGAILIPKTGGRLKLLDYQGLSFCQRQVPSCEYDCQDWAEGGIYNITGTFFFESPPPGWSLSLDQYFEVKEKQYMGKVTFRETLGVLAGEIRSILERYFGSGRSYVLD